MLITLILTLWALGQPSLQLPTNARKALDNKFPIWQHLQYSKEYYGNQIIDVDRNSKPILKCQLNDDTVPDYVLGIVIKEDTTLTVHFVALVSNEDSFSVLTLASYKNPNPMMFYLYLYPRDTEIVNFGWDQANVPPELLRTFDEETMTSRFSTDCIALFHTDKNYCIAFVFQTGRFWSFSSCD